MKLSFMFKYKSDKMEYALPVPVTFEYNRIFEYKCSTNFGGFEPYPSMKGHIILK